MSRLSRSTHLTSIMSGYFHSMINTRGSQGLKPVIYRPKYRQVWKQALRWLLFIGSTVARRRAALLSRPLLAGLNLPRRLAPGPCGVGPGGSSAA
jgi:hypothetical protein